MPPWQVFARLWAMVRHAQVVMLSPSTPWAVKITLGLGLLYILSPYDLIPDWVPVFGVMDDLALAALLIAWANNFRIPKE